MPKLFVVQVFYEAIVLAEDEAEAQGLADEIQRDETGDVTVDDYVGTNKPYGWTDKSGVYHCKDGDITLGEALKMV